MSGGTSSWGVDEADEVGLVKVFIGMRKPSWSLTTRSRRRLFFRGTSPGEKGMGGMGVSSWIDVIEFDSGAKLGIWELLDCLSSGFWRDVFLSSFAKLFSLFDLSSFPPLRSPTEGLTVVKHFSSMSQFGRSCPGSTEADSTDGFWTKWLSLLALTTDSRSPEFTWLLSCISVLFEGHRTSRVNWTLFLPLPLVVFLTMGTFSMLGRVASDVDSEAKIGFFLAGLPLGALGIAGKSFLSPRLI